MPASTYGTSSMSCFFTSAVLATSLFSSGTLGHLFMSSPKPIQGNAIKDPLEASGSNFPCHGVSLDGLSGGQPMAAGSSQTLAFDLGGGANTAVHGGGSCQLSLLYKQDIAKAKDPSAWNVIYSIEGGCPANTKGNLDGGDGSTPGISGAVACKTDDQKDCVRSFNYTIPNGVESGDHILAWTWFNSVGNREMYMDCASVSVSGGTGNEKFPPMFVANLASINSCGTEAYKAYAFPQPGKYVTTPSGYYPLATPTGQCGAGSGSSPAQPTGSYGGASSSAAPSSAPVAAPTGSASAVPYQPAASLTTMITSGGPAPSAAPNAAAPSAAAPSVPASSAPAPSAAAPYASGSTGSPNANVASGNSVPCQTNSSVVCIGSNQFGLCNNGQAVPQPLAAGTVCNAGVISKRSIIRSHARQLGHNVGA